MEAEDLASQADSIRAEDPAGAAELYSRASDLGSSRASSSLGYMYMAGEGVPADPGRAELYLRRAVEAGEPKAMCNLGNLVIDRDPEEALELFERAGELGNVSGMRNAATVLRAGAGVPADMARAVMWLERAAETDVTSMAVLAHILRNGEGVPADKPRAAGYYRRAAEAGDADSQYDLAMMLDAGDGIPADKAESERWFRASAAQGDNDARLCLGGILYERSEFAEAEEVFTDAAMDGDVKAMYNLALMYAEGSLGEADMDKAAEWLEMASEKGFAYAQSMLGTVLLDRGDLEGAAMWLRRAADQGEPTARYNLGALGVSGKIEMDDKEAVRLLMSAADSGVQEAQQLLMRLSGQGALRSPAEELFQRIEMVVALLVAGAVRPVHYGAVHAEGPRRDRVHVAVPHVYRALLGHVEEREGLRDRLRIGLPPLDLARPDYDLRDSAEAVVLQQVLDLVPQLPRGDADPLPPGLQAAEGAFGVRERRTPAVGRLGVQDLLEPAAELLVRVVRAGVLPEDPFGAEPLERAEHRRLVLDAHGGQPAAQHRLEPAPGVEQGVVEVEQVEIVLPHLVAT